MWKTFQSGQSNKARESLCKSVWIKILEIRQLKIAITFRIDTGVKNEKTHKIKKVEIVISKRKK